MGNFDLKMFVEVMEFFDVFYVGGMIVVIVMYEDEVVEYCVCWIVMCDGLIVSDMNVMQIGLVDFGLV